MKTNFQDGGEHCIPILSSIFDGSLMSLVAKRIHFSFSVFFLFSSAFIVVSIVAVALIGTTASSPVTPMTTSFAVSLLLLKTCDGVREFFVGVGEDRDSSVECFDLCQGFLEALQCLIPTLEASWNAPDICWICSLARMASQQSS